MYHPHSIKVASWRYCQCAVGSFEMRNCLTASLVCLDKQMCVNCCDSDHGWSVAKLSRALPCIRHDKCGYMDTQVCVCLSQNTALTPEVCQAKHAGCHQISVLLLAHVHGEIRESADFKVWTWIDAHAHTFDIPATPQKEKGLLIQLQLAFQLIFLHTISSFIFSFSYCYVFVCKILSCQAF